MEYTIKPLAGFNGLLYAGAGTANQATMKKTALFEFADFANWTFTSS
ncbi:hypothetical protein ACSFXN_04575 [Planococcus sp. 1R117A]